jgi:hypothetical protein
MLFLLWALHSTAYFEETLIALGAIAALVGEVLAWRYARQSSEERIASYRRELADVVGEVREWKGTIALEVAFLRLRVEEALDDERAETLERLARLEGRAEAAPVDEAEGEG